MLTPCWIEMCFTTFLEKQEEFSDNRPTRIGLARGEGLKPHMSDWVEAVRDLRDVSARSSQLLSIACSSAKIVALRTHWDPFASENFYECVLDSMYI